MIKACMKRLVVLITGFSLVSATFVGVANAAMVGTQSAVNLEQRAEYISEIRTFLAQEDVKKRLVELGVDPAKAGDRVAAMTAQELQTLHARINELPAGSLGAIEVIGIVFLVLLILELVGVTNIFNRI